MLKNPNNEQISPVTSHQSPVTSHQSPVTETRRRTALLIDTGYFRRVASEYIADGNQAIPKNHAVRIDAEKTIASFREVAAMMFPKGELEQITFYDGATDHGRIVKQEHVDLAESDHVRLRLGRIANGNTQKGVDILIALDMIEIARVKFADDIILLTGDEDLMEAVKITHQMGVKVHLVGLTSAAGHSNVSRRLRFECSSYRTMVPEGLVSAVSEAPEAVIEDVPVKETIKTQKPVSAALAADPKLEKHKKKHSISRWEQIREESLKKSEEAVGRRKIAELIPLTQMAPQGVLIDNATTMSVMRKAIHKYAATLPLHMLEATRGETFPSVPREVDKGLIPACALEYQEFYEVAEYPELSRTDIRWIREQFRECVG